MAFLKLLGGASLSDDAGPLAGPTVQRHRIALLALLAIRQGGISRERLVGYLWPESDTERGRNSLKQAVHTIRRALGADAILSAGDELRLNPALVECDAVEFESAVQAGDPARAAALYTGPLLDGFFLDTTEFEHWADRERTRLHHLWMAALERLAVGAEAANDIANAATWWRRLAGADPSNSRIAARLMSALAASGDRAGAVRHAQVHATYLREELGLEPDDVVLSLQERLRGEAAHAAPPAPTPQGPNTPSPFRMEQVAPERVPPERVPPERVPPERVPPEHFPPDQVTPERASPEHLSPGHLSPEHLPPEQVGAGRATRSSRIPASLRQRSRAFFALAALVLLGLAGILIAQSRAAPADLSLVVLPFANLSGDPGDDYFSDGMSEELIHALSGVRELRVIARTSSFQFRGRNLDVRDIGRDLDVGMVLEGSVRRSGDRMRITAQLVSTRDGAHIWSDTYDRDPRDAIAVQEEIARAISTSLRLTLDPGRSPVARHSPDREAYHAYLKGRHAIVQRTPGAGYRAIRYFEDAIARDSSYALAWAGLAHAHLSTIDVAAVDPDEVLPIARSAALRALALDSTFAEAHALLGWIHTEEWGFERARAAFEHALTLGSEEPFLLIWYSRYLDNMSRFEEALDATLRAQQLDPLSAPASYNVAGSYLHLGQFEAAIEEARRLVELHPTHPLGYDALGWALVDAGRPAEAIEHLENAVKLADGRWLALANLGRAYALVGRTDDARAVIRRLERDWGELGVGNFALAAVHVALGEREEALRRLESVYRLRGAKLPHTRQWNAFEPLYGDPEFSGIVRRAGYEPPSAVLVARQHGNADERSR